MNTSHLTVENLRKQLALEEASSATESIKECDMPIMQCLRSPTTRTFNAIVQNMNHFDAIKDFLLEAEREEVETQSLIDAAEEVQAIPLASAFANATKESLSLCDGITFTLPRNAAGDVLNVRIEDSLVLKKRPGSAVVVEQAFVLPPPRPLKPLAKGEDVSENATINSRTVAYEDGRTLLKRLLGEQAALMERCHGEPRRDYERMMAAYDSWQRQRMDLFDELLAVDGAASSGTRSTVQVLPERQ